jgi:hypothetical protein
MRMRRIGGNVGLLAVMGLIVAGACGQGCPGGGAGSGNLLNQSANCSIELDGGCRVRLAFNPTAANRTISVDVTASLTNSRPAVAVVDANNNVVANQNNPTSNSVSLSFTNQNTSQHVVVVSELVNAGSTYTVTVDQN